MDGNFMEKFNFQNGVIKYHSFNARLVKANKDYSKFVGTFSLLGNEITEDFTLYEESSKIIAGSWDHLSYTISDINKIDFEDFDLDMLHKIGIHPFDSDVKGNHIVISCHSLGLIANPEVLLGQSFDFDRLKDNIEYIKNPNGRLNKLEGFANQLQELLGGTLTFMEDNDTKYFNLKYLNKYNINVSLEENNFVLDGNIVSYSGEIIPINYEDSYAVFVKDIEEFKKHLLSIISIHINGSREINFEVNEDFKVLLNKLKITKFYIRRPYNNSKRIIIRFAQGVKYGECYEIGLLETKLKEFYNQEIE